MSFDTVAGADGVVRCTDPVCRGHHEPQRFGVRVVVTAWTQGFPGGPPVISRTERHPLQLPEHCATCGGPVEVTEPPTTSGPHGRDDVLRWPVPRIPIGYTHVDHVLEPPAAALTLEQRVEQLERGAA